MNYTNGQNVKKKTNIGLIITLSVLGGVLLIASFVLSVSVMATPGYERVVKKFCMSIEKNDADLYYEIENDYFTEFRGLYSEGLDGIENCDAASDEFDNIFDVIVSTYAGKDIDPEDISKVEYEITKTDDDVDLDYLANDIEEKTGMTPKYIRSYAKGHGNMFGSKANKSLEELADQIENYKNVIEDADKAYRVDMKITVYGKNKKDKNKEKISVFVLKNGSKWSVIPDFASLDINY